MRKVWRSSPGRVFDSVTRSCQHHRARDCNTEPAEQSVIVAVSIDMRQSVSGRSGVHAGCQVSVNPPEEFRPTGMFKDTI